MTVIIRPVSPISTISPTNIRKSQPSQSPRSSAISTIFAGHDGRGSSVPSFTRRRSGRHINTLFHHLAERREIRLARRGAAECQPDAAAGLRIFQAQEFYPVVATLDIGGAPGVQG